MKHPPPPGRRATVAMGFVAGMLAGLAARGGDPARLLRESGLSVAMLKSRQARVPLSDYAALYNRVVAALGDEGFGLFSVPLRIGMFEYLCRAMIGGRNLGDALMRGAGFLALILPDLSVRVKTSPGAAGIEIVEAVPIGTGADDPRRVFAFEWLLRLLHALACWSAGRSLPLESVVFPYAPPPQADDYALIYTEHARFGGDTLIARFHAPLLALPIIRTQDDVTAFLDGAPGKIAMLYRRDHELVRQIRDILLSALPDVPGLDVIAARLHLSLRTLQRRLRQEGASFRDVKAAVRRDLALAKVGQSNRSIADIALELGYAETSAFFRAFVEWTGEAPTSYRKRLRSLTL